MAQQKIQIQKEVYNKGLLNDTINTQFTQLVQGINREAELRASIETVDFSSSTEASATRSSSA